MNLSTRVNVARRAVAMIAALTVALMGLVLTGQGVTQANAATNTILLSADATWTYNESDTDPAAGQDDRLVWTKDGFDTSAWESAQGPFGAKRGKGTDVSGFPFTTLLKQYVAKNQNVRTYHFRTEMNVTAEQLAQGGSITGEITFDDAVQVFVNGTKVAGFSDARVEEADESERNLMYAGGNLNAPDSGSFAIPRDVLHEGSNIIAVALYNTSSSSSDIYFGMKNIEIVPPGLSDLVMTIGATEADRMFTWYTTTEDATQKLQYAPTGGTFPADATTVDTTTDGQTTSGEYNHRATVTGLHEQATYDYRVGSDATGWSEVHTFTMPKFSGDYSFLFFGDPQVGASGDLQHDEDGWIDTINVGMTAFPETELLFSAGDQVQVASNENEYDTFLKPTQLRSLPLVPVNGNHDVGSLAYQQHFTVPNFDPESGKAENPTNSGGNYYFVYKDTLYVVLNSNSNDYAAHHAFMEKAVKEYGDKVKWRVLAFHHSIYSVAKHVDDYAIKALRAKMPAKISELGFDVVLMGHDHSYTRTFLMNGDGEIANEQETAGQHDVTAKKGEVLYLTANSASGSKYYKLKKPNAWYGSVINQEKVRNYSNISVKNCEITMTTYRSEAFGAENPVNSKVDEVTLHSSAERCQSPANPTVTVEPASVSQTDASQGLTVTGSDWLPNKAVKLTVKRLSDDAVASVDVEADAEGKISKKIDALNFVAMTRSVAEDAGWEVSKYEVTATQNEASVTAEFEVTADTTVDTSGETTAKQTLVVAPEKVSQKDASQGFTVTGSEWLPNEAVQFTVKRLSDDAVASVDVEADAEGKISKKIDALNFVAMTRSVAEDAGWEVSKYEVTATQNEASVTAQFEVTADAATSDPSTGSTDTGNTDTGNTGTGNTGTGNTDTGNTGSGSTGPGGGPGSVFNPYGPGSSSGVGPGSYNGGATIIDSGNGGTGVATGTSYTSSHAKGSLANTGVALKFLAGMTLMFGLLGVAFLVLRRSERNS